MVADQSNPIPEFGTLDIRDAFFGEICREADADPRVIILSDDQGAFALNRLRKDHPDQYINLGIAEQNAIDLAAGMALGGMRPFVYGITNFVSLRCAEQILVSLCQMGLPVSIIASGGGLTYSGDGPTHHATQDIAVLRAMPGMTIFNPPDAASAAAAASGCLAAEGPCYIRLEKGVLPQVYGATHDFSRGFDLIPGAADVLVAGTGATTHTAFRVCELLRESGVKCSVLDFHRLKPVASNELCLALCSASRIAVVEEHVRCGGIFSILAETMVSAGISRPVKAFSLADTPCYLYGSRDWLHEELLLSAGHIAGVLSAWLDCPETGLVFPEV